MSRKYKIHNPQGVYFVTFTVVYWIDLFVRNIYKDIVLDSFRHCIKEKDLEIFSWCIMPSHIHLILASKSNSLDKTIGEMKRHTSKHVKDMILANQEESRKEWMIWMMKKASMQSSNTKGFQLWQHHNHPIELFSNAVLQQKADYIHNNPVEAGFVDVPEAYLYSSARDYAGQRGLLRELSFLD
jgi:REP element-mobilizing transposase RayT